MPADIWTADLEVEADKSVLVEGQSGDVCGIAPHPSRASNYASACADGSVYIWDATQRRSTRQFPIRRHSEMRAGGR
jgi:WD40 repeat protein